MKLLMLVVMTCFSLQSFANVKVGVIDMQKILFTIKEGQSVRKKLEGDVKKKQGELKKQETTLKKKKEEFDKKVAVWSKKKQMEEQQKLQKMLLALESSRQKFQKEIRELEAKLTQPIVKKVYGIVEEVSKKEGIDVTFEVSTTPVVYAAKRVDLTNKVIDAHNKKYPGK